MYWLGAAPVPGPHQARQRGRRREHYGLGAAWCQRLAKKREGVEVSVYPVSARCSTRRFVRPAVAQAGCFLQPIAVVPFDKVPPPEHVPVAVDHAQERSNVEVIEASQAVLIDGCPLLIESLARSNTLPVLGSVGSYFWPSSRISSGRPPTRTAGRPSMTSTLLRCCASSMATGNCSGDGTSSSGMPATGSRRHRASATAGRTSVRDASQALIAYTETWTPWRSSPTHCCRVAPRRNSSPTPVPRH